MADPSGYRSALLDEGNDEYRFSIWAAGNQRHRNPHEVALIDNIYEGENGEGGDKMVRAGTIYGNASAAWTGAGAFIGATGLDISVNNAYDSPVDYHESFFNAGAQVQLGASVDTGGRSVGVGVGAEATCASTGATVHFKVFGLDIGLGGEFKALGVGGGIGANYSSERGFQFKFSGEYILGGGFSISVK